MAKVRVRSAGGLALEVEIEDVEATEHGLRDVRRTIARRSDELAVESAVHTILPEARRRASRLRIAGDSLAAALVVRRRRAAAVITTTLRGTKARAAGLLEFGGTVRAPIEPKGRKRALAFGGQHPVARVRTARHYRAQHYMTASVQSQLDEFGGDLRDRIVEVFRLEGFDIV